MIDSFEEIEKQAEQMRRTLTEYTRHMEDMLTEQFKIFSEEYIIAKLYESFITNQEITDYKWTYSRAILIQKCFVSKNIILPLSKAYRGEFIPLIYDDAIYEKFSYPSEIWLSKEEFMIRRLKGLL